MMLAAWLGAMLAGCKSAPAPVEYARAYPEATPRGLTLDIQVFRGTTTVEMTNTTAHAFGPSTLWLNSRYAHPVESLGVGERVVYPLSEFRDRHSDAMRGGGFFAADDPERLVLAELESSGADGTPLLHRLIVVGDQKQ